MRFYHVQVLAWILIEESKIIQTHHNHKTQTKERELSVDVSMKGDHL